MTRVLAAVLAAFAAAPSFAADATVVKLSGPVFVRAEGADKDLAAKGGEELIYGDTVKTGPGGVAQVAVGDRGAVLISENSVFTLQGDPQKTTLDFSVGEFLIGLRRKLTRGQTFHVRTPAAVAAVRGTLFWGKTDEKKTTTYAGFGHTIAVAAHHKTVLVHAGETTSVALGAAPADPTPHRIPLSYIDRFRVDGSLQGLESLVDLPKPAAPPAPPAK